MANEFEAKVLREIHMHGFMLNAFRQCQRPSSNGLLDITVALHQLSQIQKAISAQMGHEGDPCLIQLYYSFLLLCLLMLSLHLHFQTLHGPKLSTCRRATCDCRGSRTHHLKE